METPMLAMRAPHPDWIIVALDDHGAEQPLVTVPGRDEAEQFAQDLRARGTRIAWVRPADVTEAGPTI